MKTSPFHHHVSQKFSQLFSLSLYSDFFIDSQSIYLTIKLIVTSILGLVVCTENVSFHSRKTKKISIFSDI